ncbi:phosphopantetheine-binding protein [Streptomyces sp. NBC_01190]|uniref:phosphopantetheine-binding protein n=1 Tax=Streptomyces sp. NBC_01190 TaxID=2903767 RepID=UPI0038691663|nr:phosphopantetheine-binding protein [Streptomyces sp. NBC_01190]
MATDDEALAKAKGLAQEYLGRDDLDGGWFALGGSSPDAARLVSALSQQYATQVRLQDLLTADSVPLPGPRGRQARGKPALVRRVAARPAG